MRLPSVTQILQPYSDFSRINPDVLEAAATRGSEVHALCAAYALGLWIPEVPENCAGYFDSYRRWFDHYVVKVHLVEKRLTDETFGFTGTIDQIVTLKGDDGGFLPDIKTPRVPALTWRPQIAAYVHLARLNGHHVIRGGSLRLSPEGGPPILDEYTKTLNQDFAIFLSALNCFRFFSKEA